MNRELAGLETVDSGSNYRFGDKMVKTTPPRSLFDLSHLNTLTIPNAGMLVPIALWETLPQDDFDISVDCLLRVMPQVVPLYSRQRLYIYGFYSRYSDLWCNWQVFKDKGYTGTDNRKIPYLSNQYNISYNSNEIISPNDLFDYIGLPIGSDLADLTDETNSHIPAYISALPFMMYLRIYRDYFMNKNHWIADRVMLPDDDSRFRLNDNGQLLSAVDQSKLFVFCSTTKNNGLYDLYVTGNNYYFSGAMHDYPDDYFTSAVPFTQRGNPTPLTSSGTISGALDFTDAVDTSTHTSVNPLVGLDPITQQLISGVGKEITDSYSNQRVYLDQGTGGIYNNSVALLDALNKGKFSGTSISLSITLEDIRKLAVEQQMLEQLARTDGSYFQFGLSFFGEPSKAAYDFKPTYIGGTYKNIAFTEVLQTATTQTLDSQSNVIDNATGSMYGHGITGISKGRIGHIHCDDYGMIMLIACIMPDVYYSQGLDRIFTDRIEAEKFMPERCLLGFQPILNKEIYYAGNNAGTLNTDDNYLWAYQNPFDWLRYIPNHIHGKIADTTNKSFYPYTQARKFTQLPKWGRSFSSTNDVRKDYLVAPTEDAYSAQFSMNIRAVRPLPYKAMPGKLVHF